MIKQVPHMMENNLKVIIISYKTMNVESRERKQRTRDYSRSREVSTRLPREKGNDGAIKADIFVIA